MSYRAQGGRYKYASSLVNDLLDLEINVLGNRPEKLMEIYWLKAQISDKVLWTHELTINRMIFLIIICRPYALSRTCMLVKCRR